MCYRMGLSKTAEQLKVEFGIEFDRPETYEPRFEVNGFTYPQWAIITAADPNVISTGIWGLVPSWGANDISGFRKQANTLNAMIETISEKPTYKKYINQRCLIPVDRFFEWKHIGKEKIKHNITVPNDSIFCLAGIYSVINSQPYYTVLTTEANTLMAEVHNTKKRMPVVLHKEEEKLWLNNEKIENFLDRREIELKAVAILEEGQTSTLF